MVAQQNWTNGLGFRHLIEDGLTIVRGEPIDADRKHFVLGDLSSLIIQAKKGSDLVQQSVLFVTSEDTNAHESFSLLDRYLDHTESEQWKPMLERAEVALNELSIENGRLDEEQKKAVETLLQQILSGLGREPKSGIPNQPEELTFGR